MNAIIAPAVCAGDSISLCADAALSSAPPAARAALTTVSTLLWHQARMVAPRSPLWVTAMAVRTMVDPAASSDVLLIFADALDEAARAAAIEGEISLAAELHQLAALPRELAPRRARAEIR